LTQGFDEYLVGQFGNREPPADERNLAALASGRNDTIDPSAQR